MFIITKVEENVKSPFICIAIINSITAKKHIVQLLIHVAKSMTGYFPQCVRIVPAIVRLRITFRTNDNYYY